MTLATGLRSTDWVLVGVIVVLLATSGFLALAETSLTRSSRVRAQALADEGRRGAKPLLRLMDRPERFLNPVLLLVLICQLVSATLVGILANDWLGGWGVLAGLVIQVVVIFVLFEAVPKNWAILHPDRAALLTAPVVDAIIRFPLVRWISAGLIGLADLIIGRNRQTGGREGGVTESELRAMADVAHEEDVIEPEERKLIHSVIDFGDTVAREVMVPRTDIVGLEADTTVAEGLEAALAAGFSRLPVHTGNLDDVTGVAYTKDLARAERAGQGAEAVSAHARAAAFVPETKHLSDLLRDMQEQKIHMAIVVDEYGGTAGLVTLEDLIEELVGEIVDEFDVEAPAVERRPDGSLVVSGRLAVDDADEILETHLPQGPWDTVGGLVLDRLGRVPVEGEAVEVDGLRLVVQEVQGRRIGRVRIERTGVPADRTTPG